MDKPGSQSKRKGAPVEGATRTGGKRQTAVDLRESRAATGKACPPAEGKEKKVLNENLMENILHRDNLAASLKAVMANKGAAGIDGIGVNELEAHLRLHWKGIQAKLAKGSYKPAPVRRVTIPKSGGGERKLGIPTTVDRLIQQAIVGVLDPIFDPVMSEHSYGFRKGRSAHDAVEAARDFVREGKVWVVDLDIKAFFDHVNHDLLMRKVAARVRDKSVLKLIGKYLRAGKRGPGKSGASVKQTVFNRRMRKTARAVVWEG